MRKKLPPASWPVEQRPTTFGYFRRSRDQLLALRSGPPTLSPVDPGPWRQSYSCNCRAHALYRRGSTRSALFGASTLGLWEAQLASAGASGEYSHRLPVIKHCYLVLGLQPEPFFPSCGLFRRQKWALLVYKQNAASCCLRWRAGNKLQKKKQDSSDSRVLSELTWCWPHCQRWKSGESFVRRYNSKTYACEHERRGQFVVRKAAHGKWKKGWTSLLLPILDRGERSIRQPDGRVQASWPFIQVIVG